VVVFGGGGVAGSVVLGFVWVGVWGVGVGRVGVARPSLFCARFSFVRFWLFFGGWAGMVLLGLWGLAPSVVFLRLYSLVWGGSSGGQSFGFWFLFSILCFFLVGCLGGRDWGGRWVVGFVWRVSGGTGGALGGFG